MMQRDAALKEASCPFLTNADPRTKGIGPPTDGQNPLS
jgi:hypothetical protein